ncbi:leucyl aminopeptidase [Corynebacterium sp. 13CS0277]|uniref:leucyl aminopeptidase n=1 Tax=Corynebacterium sp. 13CS0277 TaxID=2071994 RepID=UPI000D026567|nr:leucyl aminopeptidase [Corynebacterium sp. 13CS0277]PRQ11120.1 leucyl aminopeptidase [Corynebacterium sp. 13CS0277]
MSDALTLPARGHVPEMTLAASLPEDCEALLIPVLSDGDGLELPSVGLGDQVDRDLLTALGAVKATGQAGEVTRVPAPEGLPVEMVIAVGLGEDDSVDAEALRRAAGSACRGLKGIARIATTLGVFGVADAVLGCALGAYTYRGRKTAAVEDSAQPVGHITFLSQDVAKDESAFADAVTLVDAVVLARDLVNTSSDALYPASYAAVAREAGEAAGLDVEVLDFDELQAAGFGGIVGVGQGSVRKPRLVRLSYTPANATAETKSVALVGKGITFDTGGISIKPGAQMDHMISDMGGSAAVIASVIAAARLGLGVKVTATVPMAENMPGGGAYRPGDILTQYGGTTVEILNTDAEGRLVLADAIARACEDHPDYLIETATLTGAQLVALGDRTTGVMGSEDFRDRVAALGRSIGEQAWAMPLPEEITERLKSPVADLRNITTDRLGGMLAAGAFLGHFVADGVEWVHLDVAGPAFNTHGAYGYVPARGTGNPVRTIVATLADIAEQG